MFPHHQVTVRHRAGVAVAFTLVELLVVVGIIAVLVALLLPALAAARRSAEKIRCAARLRAVGHAAAMYAQENRLFVPFAAYANVSANLVQQPVYTSTPPSSYQLYSGLLVHRYLGGSVEQIFCPSGDDKGWLPQQELFRRPSGAWQVWTNYIHRGTTMELWPKLTRSRQGWMQDWYWTRASPMLVGDAVNHSDGINCLYSDGSVVFHKLPPVWRDNTIEAWTQVDHESFQPM
jgi:prepilin-type processing-associated H-X9-DG protein